MKNKIISLLNSTKNKIKDNRITFAIFIIVWIILIVITLSLYKASLGKESFGNDNFVASESNVLPINERSSVKETVYLEKDINSISFQFATYARKNSGFLIIKIIGEKSNFVYLNKQINVSNIQDNSYKTFELNNSKNKISENIIVDLSSNSDENKCIGVYYSQKKAFNNSTLLVNNCSIEGDLKIRFLANNQLLKHFSNKIIIFSIIGISLIVLLWFSLNKYEWIFSISALILGLIFMIIITPMSPPDEQVHYEYSFQLSNYVFGYGDKHLEIDKVYQDYSNFSGHLNVSSAYKKIEKEINKPLELSGEYLTMMNDVLEAKYYLCYVPQTLGIVIGRILSLNMLKTFYLGRFFNLMFYSICVYLAIRKTPIYKFLFGVIATLPIILQQAASYSYDTFLIGLLLVIASFFIDWMISDKKISIKEILQLFILVVLVSPLKAIYDLFIFAFIFVPKDKFITKKRKAISLLIICIPIIIQLLAVLAEPIYNMFKYNKDYLKGDSIDTVINNDDIIVTEEEIIDNRPKYSVWYVTNYLTDTLALLYRTIRFNIKIWFYESVGRVLSGESLLLPLTISHLLTAIVLASSIRKEDYYLKLPVKIYNVLSCIAIGFLTVFAMMVTWTRVGDEYVQGMQGRYFSPLLMYFLPVFNNKYISIPKKFDKYIAFIQLMVIFEVIIYVLSYTFVN